MPWALGPPDGRYLQRHAGDSSEAPAAFVVVITTLGAPERRRLLARKKQTQAQPEPDPVPVTTTRATVIQVADPLASAADADTWLRDAGEEYLTDGIAVLNRALHVFRLVTADPYVNEVGRSQAIIARIGFGAGEQVADGLWADARELVETGPRRRRLTVLQPQARLAAVLSGREQALACEELALRVRLDLDHGRQREAALQLLVALDAAVAELPRDPTASDLGDRVDELRAQREPVGRAAQSALAGPLTDDEIAAVMFALGRIEAALRARAVANA